jgi:hypothetical protein
MQIFCVKGIMGFFHGKENVAEFISRFIGG